MARLVWDSWIVFNPMAKLARAGFLVLTFLYSINIIRSTSKNCGGWVTDETLLRFKGNIVFDQALK